MAPTTYISAHRCGAGGDPARENTQAALDDALALGVDYIEFDVQRCRDGALVLSHDPVEIDPADIDPVDIASEHLLRYEDVLTQLRGRARAHIDLKFTSPPDLYERPESTYEVAAAKVAVDVLGAENIVVTTSSDKSVLAIRDWAQGLGLDDLRVGLSLGKISDLIFQRRYQACKANLVVADHRIARISAARFARRAGMPLLVWTVDRPSALRYWLRPGSAWIVTTNVPEQALGI